MKIALLKKYSFRPKVYTATSTNAAQQTSSNQQLQSEPLSATQKPPSRKRLIKFHTPMHSAIKVRTEVDDVDYNTIQEVGINIGIYKKNYAETKSEKQQFISKMQQIKFDIRQARIAILQSNKVSKQLQDQMRTLLGQTNTKFEYQNYTLKNQIKSEKVDNQQIEILAIKQKIPPKALSIENELKIIESLKESVHENRNQILAIEKENEQIRAKITKKFKLKDKLAKAYNDDVGKKQKFKENILNLMIKSQDTTK